jgi:hypothetical protein
MSANSSKKNAATAAYESENKQWLSWYFCYLNNTRNNVMEESSNRRGTFVT